MCYNETNQLWNFTTSNLIWTSPIVVDIDNDGENEVLFGGFNQKFYCLHANGTLKWSYSDFYLNPINVNFAVGDINGDGKNEIIFAKFARLYALNGTGQLIWTRQFSIYKIDGITLADVTNDKIPEILFNLSNNTLIALNGNGSIYKSIKINLSLSAAPLILENMIITQNSSDIIALDYGFNLLWSTELNLTITSPVAADLNHDSYYEIVVNSISDNETVILKLNGTIISCFEVDGYFSSYSVPAIGDLNNDTVPDLVISSSLLLMKNISGDDLYTSIGIGYGINYPTIGDINGDGVPEILFSTDNGDVYIVYIPNAFKGNPWTLMRNTMSRRGILNDNDHDGLANYIENILGTDENKKDSDNDKLNDWDEVNVYNTNPLSNDTDNDKMPEYWEVFYNLNLNNNTDALLDNDNDGVLNKCEYFNNTNPNSADTDNDLMPDGWEIKYGLNPLANNAANDTDGDKLTDLQEYKYGTNPIVPDSDGDGFLDGEEILQNTDPLNPLDNPTSRTIMLSVGIASTSILIIVILLIIRKRRSSVIPAEK
ncbi:MAG: FG-GAP-like repeat-containing protein [Promethearchaeota archaeon]